MDSCFSLRPGFFCCSLRIEVNDINDYGWMGAISLEIMMPVLAFPPLDL